jgi:hypothetical protein
MRWLNILRGLFVISIGIGKTTQGATTADPIEHWPEVHGESPVKLLLALTVLVLLLGNLSAEPGPAKSEPSKDSPAKPAAPALLPGRGLEEHDFFYAGESKRGRKMFIVKKGRVIWTYDDPKGRGEISDATLLSNGNVLLAHQFAVKLVAPDQKVLWNYDAPAGNEIHTAQMIGREHVLFIQNGTPALLKVVDIVSGETKKQFPLSTRDPSPHGQFRHARLTAAGTLLVAHMDSDKVCEYDADGNELLALPAARPWGVMELSNGHILITDRLGVHEVTRQNNTVWELARADVPDYQLSNLQLAWRLPNGNTLINVWFYDKSATLDEKNLPVQALELTPEKKVVWALRSYENPDLGPATTVQILDQPDTPENVKFGDIK